MATDLLTLYNNSTSQTIAVARVRGKNEGSAGVNFFGGNHRAPGSNDPDTFQGEFTEHKEGTNLTPATTNDKSYPLSTWTDTALKIGFEGAGPAKLGNKGYWMNSRFTMFKDSAGRFTGDGKLHTYAPITGNRFQDLNTSAKTRITANAYSTSPASLQG